VEQALLSEALDSRAPQLAQEEVLDQEMSLPQVVLGATYGVVPEGVEGVPASLANGSRGTRFGRAENHDSGVPSKDGLELIPGDFGAQR